MIKRLRPIHDERTLKSMYAAPHDHRIYGRGHAERVAAMIEMVSGYHWSSAADLSCGNGYVLDSITADVKYYGDIAPGYEFTGPIERTIFHLPSPVELFIMGETIEHLDAPSYVLLDVARRSQHLLLSTPVEAWDDTNAEHYWAWDRDGVEGMLAGAGWETVDEYTEVDARGWGEPYKFGIWRATW